MNPLVSIIIPCYQAEKTIRATIRDLLAQTYHPVEIIAVDDQSNDRTVSILRTFNDSLTIIRQKHSGAAAARNRGFRSSHGPYILFCDSDIRLKKSMIQKMVQTLQKNSDKAYCYSNFKFGIHTFDLFPFDAQKLRQENYISTMSLIRRDCFIGFDESLTRYQDWDLWKRMLDRGYEGVWYPERLFSGPQNWSGISRFSFGKLLLLLRRKIFRK
ncbi:MAG: glycosyltransferase family A protein [Patescibacteria group bacterium]|nr:glycosyltransferase family A protein [Patescibacteria group bacterium]